MPNIALTKSEVLQRFRQLHGDTYDYSKLEYVSSKKQIDIICRTHGLFSMLANNHLHGRGCRKCAMSTVGTNRTRSTEDFVKRANLTHKSTYSYGKVRYKNASTKITITCKEHGDFSQTPVNHLQGQGCRKCGTQSTAFKLLQAARLSFVKKAQNVHGSKYRYTHVVYLNNVTKVTITCKDHGYFEQAPFAHLLGQGCPKCNARGYSKAAITWIEQQAYSRRLKNMQHAENSGEFYIPGTKYRADGYHAATRTVFEFYGDIWHGNIKVLDPNGKPNPYYPNLTARQLYEKTMKREAEIKALGYKVVSIWETTWRASNGA